MTDVRSQPTLGDYLVREGILTQAQLNQALEEQMTTTRSIGRILVDMGFLSENARMIILQNRFGYELMRLNDLKIEPSVLTLIPYTFADKHRVVPVRREDEQTLVVAMEDPSDILITDAIKNQIGLRIKAVVASHEDIQGVLGQYSTLPAAPGKAAQAAVKHGKVYNFFKLFSFPVLAFSPLALFMVLLYFDSFGLARKVMKMKFEGSLTFYDLLFYIALIWGSWTLILFEINGLIFDPKSPEDE